MMQKQHSLNSPFHFALSALVALISIVLMMSSCSSSKSQVRHGSKKERAHYARTYQPKKTRKVSDSDFVLRQNVVATAMKYIGKPYRYGGKQPQLGFDCSGFTSYVFQKNNVSVTGPSYSQAKLGKKKSMKEVNVGDLIFFGSDRDVTHVGIIANVESDKVEVIHSTSSRGVVVDDITNSSYWQKRYLFVRDVIR